jgi:hypothetical protein
MINSSSGHWREEGNMDDGVVQGGNVMFRL